jgi:hypothetical protein
MESHKDERGSLYALMAHSQACRLRLVATSLESGQALIGKRRDSIAANPLRSRSVSSRYASVSLPMPNSLVPREPALAERKVEFVP